MQKNCLVIAGEKSGEEHCLSFFNELRTSYPDVNFFGVGGDNLKDQGLELLYHLKDFSSWGVTEVVAKIPFYLKASDHILAEVFKRKCKVAILIDFQDFNLRLAKKLKRLGVNVLYYVAPQAWAWRSYRARVLEKNVHTLFSIIPFEKEWFRSRGVSRVKAVEHPLLRTFRPYLNQVPKREWKAWQNRPLKILLLPGSRDMEVKNLLPTFMETIKSLKQDQEVETHLVETTSVTSNLYDPWRKDIDRCYSSDDLIEALKTTDLCLASSGTVTLACALFQLPTVVCYKVSLVTEFIFWNFLSYRGHIALPNIIHQLEVFPEILQSRVNKSTLSQSLEKWLHCEDFYQNTINTLSKTSSLLSGDDFSLSDYIGKAIRDSYDFC